MKRFPVIVLLLALSPCGAAAQAASASPSTWPVAVGDRVRIALPRGGDNGQKRLFFPPLRASLDGRVVRQTTDSLYVQQHPDLMPVAVSQATAPGLYVTRGRSRTRSALSNAIIGAVAGIVLVNVAQSTPSSEQSTVDFYAPYAAAGAGLGVIHGILSPSEFWRRVR